MAKLTKNQLKSIVKECLVEILAEGLASSTDIMVEAREKPRAAKKKRTQRAQPARNPALDEVAFNRAAEQRASSITDDPIMQSILADTARTTLQEQVHADKGAGGASMQETVAPGKNIEDIPIFTEGAQNWAALAFAEKKRP